jgi:hypothetical protein
LKDRKRGPGAVRAVLGVLLLAAASAPSSPAGGAAEGVSPLAKYLPSPATLGGWAVKDPPQAFEQDDLFLYIDGGAEIYHEYGFVRVLVQDYWRGEDSISLEIYEMTTPAAAFGIFAFKRGPDGEPVDIGAGASLEGYYLNFWKGRFLVTLTGMNASEATVRGLLAAARSVAARIDESGAVPHLAGALPPDGLVPSSVKYMKGPLGLLNVYPFLPGNVFAPREGVKGDYPDGHSLLILAYGSAGEASEALGRAEVAFRAGSRYRRVTRDGATLRVADEDGRAFRIAARGDVLIVVFGASSPDVEAGIVEAAAARVARAT